MDSNGTRFHLLCGKQDWERAFIEDGQTTLGALWSGDGAVAHQVSEAARSSGPGRPDTDAPELTLRPLLARFKASTGDRPVSQSDRRGAARDRYGNWYFVSEDRARICVQSIGNHQLTTFWPLAESGPPRSADPADFRDAEPARTTLGTCCFTGLTITRDHHLVATSTLEGRSEILVFDLFSGGPPVRLRWPKEVPLAPWDLAPRDPGGFWLLDREGRRLWEVNTYFQVVRSARVDPPAPESDDFISDPNGDAQHARGSGAPPCDPVARVTLEHAVALSERDPIAVEPLPGGGALVLDGNADAPAIGAYRDFTRRGSASLDGIVDVIEPDPAGGTFRLEPHDFAVITSPSADLALDPELLKALAAPLLFVTDSSGNQAFCFELAVSESGAPSVEATEQFLPLRLFGGAALVASEGRAYYDGFGRFVPLVIQDRPKYEPRAVIFTPPMDGDAPGCVWHRIIFDGCIPSGTAIRMSSRATDADGADIASLGGPAQVAGALARLPWDDEPLPALRMSGSELPWLRAEATGGFDSFELLVQRARGRYFQLRITLEGDGRRTPRLRALRTYFPRFSYLSHYLPACYRDDATSGSLLDRLLANYEGLVTSLEDRVLALGTVCEPSATPAEFLDWLGRWYAVYLDPAWPPYRKRLFLSHAMTFFQWRGTARGLRAALRLAFDDCVDDSIFTEEGDRSRTARRFRVIEGFQRRALPTTAGKAPAPCAGIDPEPSPDSLRWEPSAGLEALNRRWRAATGTTTGDYPVTQPADAGLAAQWTSFSQATLGFIPAPSAAEVAPWQQFLRCRYPSFVDASAAWGAAFDADWDSFADVTFPERLPSSAGALGDWVVFHRLVTPMRAAAHRFTVSLPVQPERAKDAESIRTDLHLADRLIALEKPSHSAYRVELYWALFRVGQVRLGADTELGQGSRLPELLPPLVLGEGALAEGRLGPRPQDWNGGRFELGRNPLLHTGSARSSTSPLDFGNP